MLLQPCFACLAAAVATVSALPQADYAHSVHHFRLPCMFAHLCLTEHVLRHPASSPKASSSHHAGTAAVSTQHIIMFEGMMSTVLQDLTGLASAGDQYLEGAR